MSKIRKKILIVISVIIILILILIASGLLIAERVKNNGIIDTGTEEVKNYCPEESRNADVCIQLYQPVCGWFDSAQVQCVRYPCAYTCSNSCFACMDDKVEYWTDGECPA